MSATEDNRSFTVTSSLGKDGLLFYRIRGREQISRCFEYVVEVLSDNKAIDPGSLLGSAVNIEAKFKTGATRHFGGHVAEFAQLPDVERHARYEIVLRPWLWLLTRASNCRIFQEKSVPDIISSVFSEHGFTDVNKKLSETYTPREYCVQYRETDFDFVSRLMEEEGIYYFFSFNNKKHYLNLLDSNASHATISGYAKLPFFPPGNVAQRERDHIYAWSPKRVIQSGKYTLDDFDFEKPSAELQEVLVKSKPGTHTGMEQYDYPGRYFVNDLGKKRIAKRLEALQARYRVYFGEGNVFGLEGGCIFTLENHGQTALNLEYLVTGLELQMCSNDYSSTAGAGQTEEFVRIDAIPNSDTFRAPQETPKPMVRGPQTAIVVGKSGEEIWTDKYGRVKVQFHWDRVGKKDENSSCWIRVSQPWAGKGWGAIAIPRIGQEVIVDFLEGDPDRPIIVGRVYNAEQTVPYALPANATQTGIKSRSSKEGSADNFNEIRLEDKKGSEEIYVHAEKNMNVIIENNETRKIGFDKKDAGDQTIDIYNHRTTTLEQGNDKLQLKAGNRDVILDKGNHAFLISKGNFSLTISKGNRTALLDVGNDSLTLKQGNRTTTLDVGHYDLTLKQGNRTTVLDQGNDKLNLKQGNRETVLDTGGDKLNLKSGNREVTLDAGNHTLLLKAGNQSTKLNAGKSATEAMQSIELKVGGNSIKIDQTGITIKGLMIKIDGSVQTEVKGLMTTVSGTAMLTAKGGIVMIN